MKITTVHDEIKPFHRPVKLTQILPLSETVTGEGRLSTGTVFYIPSSLKLEPYSAKTADINAAVSMGNPVPPQITLEHFAKNFVIGTGAAAIPLQAIPLSAHATVPQIASHLEDYGIASTASKQVASAGLDFARSNLGHLCFFFLAGTAIGIGTVEALKPAWTWKRKIIYGCGLGAIFVIIALILMWLGVLAPSKGHEHGVTPKTIRSDSKPKLHSGGSDGYFVCLPRIGVGPSQLYAVEV